MKITFSTKCVYALRILLELSIREGFGVVKSQQIASSQGILLRFLEIILSELRQGGFVDSRRGNSGGYVLSRLPEEITVAQVIDFIEGHKALRSKKASFSYAYEDPFERLWQKIDRTCTEILSSTTFADLASEEMRKRSMQCPNYVI
jgi:Rrf2 family cysteine metabolism transcriptional repressor